jgi:hypothetical protein
MSTPDAKAKKVANIVNVKSFDQFKALTSQPTLSVVHFWASWANQVTNSLFIVLETFIENVT